MEIIKTENGTEVTLKLVGWLDTQAAPELKKEVDKLKDDEKLVLDMCELEYVASSGLRQFVAAYKKVNGKMVLRNVSDNILGILKTTGLDKRIPIE
ncbi:MAG: STAS domain-containing protein [Eubacterium sp.]|nr:STAS domain-containing protein [Eubacterium sp.]